MRRLRDPRVQDAILALAFLVVGAIDMLTTSKADGPDWANVACAVVLAGAVLVRRAAPAGAALTFFATLFVLAAWLTSPTDLAVPFFGLLLFPYAAASRAAGRRGALVLAAMPVTVIGVSLVAGAPSPVGESLFPIALGAASYLAGRAVRSRVELAAELHEAAVRAQEEQEGRAARAVAEERRRIAREMHDVVAHSITTMVVQAGGARRILELDPQRAVDAGMQIERTGRETLLEMRRLLGVLHPRDAAAARAPQPGLDGLQALIGRARDSGLPVELTVEGEQRSLAAGVDLAAYRVVQEALTNALAHGAASPTEVRVRWCEDAVELEVADRGPGPAPAAGAGGEGHGLIGMRERVRLYGGELQTGRRRGGGFEVKARIPFTTEEMA